MVRIRRNYIVWTTILFGLILAWEETYAKAAPDQTAGKKPNIVFILVDNLGYGELGAYGGGILRGAPTTRIDKLASEGTRLLNFNVEAQCTPSRSALMTGRFSIRSGTYAVPIGGVADGLTLWEVTSDQFPDGESREISAARKWLSSFAERSTTLRDRQTIHVSSPTVRDLWHLQRRIWAHPGAARNPGRRDRASC